MWWFGGDEEAARQSFEPRGTVSLEAWNLQMNDLDAKSKGITEVFDDHTLVVVGPGPVHLSPPDIYERMFPAPT